MEKKIYPNLHLFFNNLKTKRVSLRFLNQRDMTKERSLKEKWGFLTEKLTEKFSEGEELNVDGIIYLIGVQELGKGYRTFKKDEKLNLMHIAICKLLEPYGYYEFDFFDEDGWPHYKIITELPNLKPGEQTILMKEAILSYFESLVFFED
jgi:hypothetical protein